ncbi:unnamed protein product [Somion occarium]|uniref:Virilizer N-terminal domain-containing protein n=1 Tax=Somion occarium TaxID=3059160 RepID=A0ABP1CXL8_9APHY
MTTLLQWCTLEPQGISGLAAVRFPTPVRVQTISIFPTDARPFLLSPDVVARTEPEAFFLEVYFNAHPTVSPDGKEKPKPTNALVPTVIAYAGGRMSFSVNMSRGTATRLMIVKGGFETVSMAIYGELVNDAMSLPSTYTPKNILPSEPPPVAKAIDPSMSRDPTHLARQLLALIPNAPPLPLVIQLMFCLKPSNEDWDLPEFPFLHPSLDQEIATFDLEQADTLTTRPVAEDTKPEQLEYFANLVAGAVGDKDDRQAYIVANILSNVASQMPDMAKTLLQAIDLSVVFDAYNMDEVTLYRLTDAAANPDISRHLQTDWFLSALDAITKDMNNDRATRSAARHLLSRIQGSAVVEDALSNTQGDFSRAAEYLADASSQEASFGVWLASFVTHEGLVKKLSENPIIPTSTQYPPLLLKRNKPLVSHDEFVAFVRAFIGVACVLAVYAWADSLPDRQCRERVLGILRLWQDVDGYREILNHLLLLRQMIFRLECMLDNDLPTKAGVDAEHILVNLAQNPQSFLCIDYMKCILSLEPPHSFITYDERMSMRRAAIIAEDGLLGAVDELTRKVERPPTVKSLRGIRVALAIIERELDEEDEYDVLEEFWKEGSRGCLACLVDAFLEVSEELEKHFTLFPPPPAPSGLLAWLFHTCNDLLRLIIRLVPDYPLPGRAVRSLTISAANVFFCSDAVDMLYSQLSPLCIAAQEIRRTCISLTRVLANISHDGNKAGAQVVLRTLLEHGLQSEERDPAHHLLQVFGLIDYLLPMPDTDDTSTMWTQKVMPNVLKEMWAFCRVLDTENRAHLVRRLVGLDDGVVGIGDWILQEELNEVLQTLYRLLNPNLGANYRFVKQYQVANSIRFLLDLASSSASISAWFIRCIGSGDDLAPAFAAFLRAILDANLMCQPLVQLAQSLASHSSIDQELCQPLTLTLLRGCWTADLSSTDLASALHSATQIISALPFEDISLERITLELGALVSSLEDSPHTTDPSVVEAVTEFLDWFAATSRPLTLPGFSRQAFSAVCDQLTSSLNAEQKEVLDAIQASLEFTDDSEVPPAPTILPDSVKLSIHDVEELLHTELPIPSTPPRKALAQDVLSLVTVSPPTALIRSPAATGLTKTYSNNDFRQLRQTPSARQNTSRLPSMHVDVGFSNRFTFDVDGTFAIVAAACHGAKFTHG